MNRKKIKLNFTCYPVPGRLPYYASGSEIYIECDDAGVPVDRYWFRRYQDAKLDNCIEFVKEKSSTRKFKKPLKDSDNE